MPKSNQRSITKIFVDDIQKEKRKLRVKFNKRRNQLLMNHAIDADTYDHLFVVMKSELL